MTELASTGQLRAGFMRWALFCVPGILLLGLLFARIAGSGPGNPWYAALVKPEIYPSDAAFGIIWTVLYILMGLAIAIVAAARGAASRKLAIWVFVVQLALNLAWSPLFFAAHQLLAAFALLIVLDLVVVFTIVTFKAVRPVAALLLLPYLAWILFATFLNWQILLANPNYDGRVVSGAATRVEF